MTPLDSSHLEVFLGFFWEFFIFLNSNLNFEFGPVWYRPKPESDRTGLTGNRSNRTGSHLLGEPRRHHMPNLQRVGCRVNPVKPVRSSRARTKPAQIQNLNLNFKKWKNFKKFLKIIQGATNLMVSNFLKNSFV